MFRAFAAALVLALAVTASASAQQPGGPGQTHDQRTRQVGDDDEPVSKNPDRIPNRIEEAEKRKDTLFRTPRFDRLVRPWYDFKKKLSERYGFDIGFFYHTVYQKADRRIIEPVVGEGRDEASGHNLQILGQWELLGRGTNHPGFLGFHFQQRSRIGPVVPNNLGFQVGSLWPTQGAFSELDFSAVELYWLQFLIKDRLGFVAGKQIPFAAHDYFAYKSPLDGFSNANFTVNPTISYAPAGLSVGAGARPLKSIYIIGGMYDGQGKLNRGGYESFFDDRQYFTAVDVGWDPGYLEGSREVYFGPIKVRDVHATFWHKDHLQRPDIPEGWGYTLFAEAQIGDVVPFFRFGKSHGTQRGNPALLDKMIAGGVGLTNVFGQNNDLIGIGLSWGRSELPEGGSENVDLTGDGSVIVDVADIARALVREEQYTGEIFYRIQLTNELQVTPHVQLTWNPILNREESYFTVWGVRGRAEF